MQDLIALAPPPLSLRVSWEHEAVTVRPRGAKCSAEGAAVRGAELLVVAAAVVGAAHLFAPGTPVERAAWWLAIPGALVLTALHRAWESRDVEVRATTTVLELRVRAGGRDLWRRREPLEHIRRVRIEPGAAAGGAPRLCIDRAGRRGTLRVQLIGYGRNDARWLERLVGVACARNARFWRDVVGGTDRSAGIAALVDRAVGGPR